MNYKENFFALMQGKHYESVPIWLMGFENEDTARRLNLEYRLPDNLSHNPETTDYPWNRISDEERERTLNYNEATLRPVVAVGWGANMSLGHGGPGEFHFHLLECKKNERILECETGCKRIVRKFPHFYKDFDYPLSSASEVEHLVLPDPHDPARYRGFEDDVAFFKKAGFVTAGNLNGFFSGPHYLCLDYQEFLVSLLIDPKHSRKLIDKIGAWNIIAAEEMLLRGIDCIILCDDLGSSDNLIISPELYKQFIFPWHKKLCDLTHEFGAYVHLHSHGNINTILPLILSTGIDMLDPFDSYETMDIVAFIESNCSRMAVPVGGLNKFFFEWARDKQNEYMTSLFKRAKVAGRWMFMDTGGIPENTTKETYDFFMERLAELAGL